MPRMTDTPLDVAMSLSKQELARRLVEAEQRVSAERAINRDLRAERDEALAERQPDPVCTDCGGSGVTHQTERPCTCSEDGDEYERAAIAAFREAQSVYRSDHDHFPLRNTWERLDERTREGWRRITSAALTAAKAKAPVLDEDVIANVIAPYFKEGYTARDAARAVMRLLPDERVRLAKWDEVRDGVF